MKNELFRVLGYCVAGTRKIGLRLAMIFVSVAIVGGCSDQQGKSPTDDAQENASDGVQSELAKRSGGFVFTRTGELIGIKTDGSIGESCILCVVGESPEACEERAGKKEARLCRDVFSVVEGVDVQKEKTSSSVELISTARAQNQLQMCFGVVKPGSVHVSGPNSIPKTAHGNGFACWDSVGFIDNCVCAEL